MKVELSSTRAKLKGLEVVDVLWTGRGLRWMPRSSLSRAWVPAALPIIYENGCNFYEFISNSTCSTDVVLYNLPSTLSRVVQILTSPSTSIQVLPSNTSNFPIRIFPFDFSSPSTRPQHRITLWSFWRSWHHGKLGIQKLPRFPPPAIAKLAYIIVQRSTRTSSWRFEPQSNDSDP